MERKSVLLTLIGLIFGLWHSTNGVCADRIAFICFRGPDAEICTINPNGTGQKTLTKSPNVRKSWPTWSPDRTQIAFAGSPTKLYLMNADGGNVRVLKEDYPSLSRPAWSPDGRTIAYGVHFHIKFLDVQTGEEKLVWVPAESDIRDVAWSPDGQQLAFATKKIQQARDIYIINIDGTGLAQLTQHPAEDRMPAWSPDGQQITFVSHRNVIGGGIFLMDVDGSNIKELTDEGESFPSWSPDGTQIACQVRLGNKGHVAVMEANGRDLKVIMEGNMPSWQSTFPGLLVQPKGKLVLRWGWIKFDRE